MKNAFVEKNVRYLLTVQTSGQLVKLAGWRNILNPDVIDGGVWAMLAELASLSITNDMQDSAAVMNGKRQLND